MTISYDRAADVLYITFEKLPPGSYRYVEKDDGDVLRIENGTGRVVGVTVPFFARRAKNGKLVIPEIGPGPAPWRYRKASQVSADHQCPWDLVRYQIELHAAGLSGDAE